MSLEITDPKLTLAELRQRLVDARGFLDMEAKERELDALRERASAPDLWDDQEEARNLYPLRHRNALQTVGYQEIFGFMENKYDMEECVRLLKRNSRRYAKRQLTWFRKDPEFTWFSPHDVDAVIRYVEGTFTTRPSR